MQFIYPMTDDEGYDIELTITVNGLDIEEVYDSYDGHWVTSYDVRLDSIDATLEGEPYKLSEELEQRITCRAHEIAADWASDQT